MHPHCNGSGKVRGGKGGGTSRGVLCGCRVGWLVGWLALMSWRCLEKVVPYVQKLVLSKVSV